MRSVEEQTQILHNAGFRVTQPRLAVLETLARAEGTLDAATIHDLGRRFHPRLGRVSVYRALELLTELGLARKIHRPDGCHRFARADSAEGHYLICQACGQIQEFPCDGLEHLVASVGERYGYQVQDHLLQLEGICPDCG